MKIFAKTIHFLVTTLIILYLVSGLGIARYQLIEPLTFGLLTKAWAFRIHSWLFWPFVIVLALHIGLALYRRKKYEKNKQN